MSRLKRYAIQIAQVLVVILPLTQLSDITYVTDLVGKFGLHGVLASVVASQIVLYFKQSPLKKK